MIGEKIDLKLATLKAELHTSMLKSKVLSVMLGELVVMGDGIHTGEDDYSRVYLRLWKDHQRARRHVTFVENKILFWLQVRRLFKRD